MIVFRNGEAVSYSIKSALPDHHHIPQREKARAPHALRSSDQEFTQIEH
jgi:hypothetical protein